MMKLVEFQSKPLLLAVATAVAVLSTGCKDQSIRVYSIPKERPTPDRQMMADPSSRGVPHLHWDALPESWKEIPASAMRAASFEISGPDGQRANVGAIPMPPVGDNEISAVVNMWRANLELPELPPAEISNLGQPITVAGVAGKLFEMVSETTLNDEPTKHRALAAMASIDEATWFFKLTGSDPLVAAEKQNFVQWLETVEVHEGSHDEPAPQMSTTSSNTGNLPNWTIPDGWTPQQPGQMLLASFGLPGGDANVTVMSLGGDGGGLLPNINRWRGQLGLAAIDSRELSEVTETIETVDGPGTLVDIEGNDQRLLAVIIPHQGRSWFYKSMGPSDIVGRERDAFVQFAQTAKH